MAKTPDCKGLAARYGLPPDAPAEIGRYALEPEVFCRRCRLTLPVAWRRHRGACRCERPEPALLVPRKFGACSVLGGKQD